MDTDWIFFSFERPVQIPARETGAALPPVGQPSAGHISLKGVCCKCGRHIGRGLFFHARYCEV